MNIAIIGCGYVGSNLAKFWSQKGYFVTCTTRTIKNAQNLENLCQKAMILKSTDLNDLEHLVQNNDLILVTVAADSIDDYENTYLAIAKFFRKVAQNFKKPKKLFYTSSSSVYGEHNGKWVDETSELLAKNDQGKVLIETENAFLSLKEFGWNVCIFRLSEIYGPQRDLASHMKRLQGNIIPGTGHNYTNMVHLEDIVGAIDYAFNHHLEGVFNLSDDDHVIRKELYNQLCDQMNLEHINWDVNLKRLHKGNKRVSNHKIKSQGYTFKYPHRILN